MRSNRIVILGTFAAICVIVTVATARPTTAAREAPAATGVKVVVGKDISGCKGPAWESNGVGFDKGRNCQAGKMCCETIIVGSRGVIVDLTPPATGIKVVVGKDTSGCKGPVWESNGVGFDKGTNCQAGRLCCETTIAGSRGTVVDLPASTR